MDYSFNDYKLKSADENKEIFEEVLKVRIFQILYAVNEFKI